jgi:Lon protease-like protein
MLFNRIPTETENLPSVITLLPLPGLILMPRSELKIPLGDLFSLSTIAEVVSGGELIIGIVQTRGSGDGVFSCGCAGQVLDHYEGSDGRIAFTVQGVCRFEIIRQLPPNGHIRRAEVSYDKYQMDVVHEADFSFDRERLMNALGKYCRKLQIEPPFGELAEMSNEKLISMLMMVGPFDSHEKQALLETKQFSAQSRLLTLLIEQNFGVKDSVLYH